MYNAKGANSNEQGQESVVARKRNLIRHVLAGVSYRISPHANAQDHPGSFDDMWEMQPQLFIFFSKFSTTRGKC